jgi:hypothetical protein
LIAAESVQPLSAESRANSDTDVVVQNLRCTGGLPGAEAVDLAACLTQLDNWSSRVKTETKRHLYKFRQNPAEFEHSEGYFRMLMMAVVVAEDFGVRYNPARVGNTATVAEPDDFFADSRDVFLHGVLGPQRLGTCSSMPILYLALGRRLGYPLKLVTTKAHLFLRWESDTERFNLEATGRGMNRYDDEHYRQWPFPLTEQEIQEDGYLQSLTPAGEQAVFLSIRSQCFRTAGRLAEAQDAGAEAVRLAPEVRSYRVLLAETRADRYASTAAAIARDLTPPLPVAAPRGPEPAPIAATLAIEPDPRRQLR